MKRIHSIAAACACLTVGAASAQSSLTLYGIVGMDFVTVNNVGAGATRLNALNNGSLASSRFGFRGEEDLGGGLSTFFTLESGINVDNGTGNATRLFNRGSYVGLKGSMGAVSFGRQWNLNDAVLGKFFKFGSYSAFRYTDYSYISDLHDNAVKYVSPKFGAFQFSALAAAGEGGNGTLNNRKAYEAGGTYDAGRFSAALTYHKRYSLTTDNADTLASGGLAYGMGPVTGRFGISLSNPKAAGTAKSRSLDLGVDYNVSAATTVSLDYVTRDVKDSGDDSAFVRLLGIYQLSKRTSFYTNVIRLNNKGNAAQTIAGVGTILPGRDQTLFGLGIRHNF